MLQRLFVGVSAFPPRWWAVVLPWLMVVWSGALALGCSVEMPPVRDGMTTGTTQINRDPNWTLASLSHGKAEGFARVISVSGDCPGRQFNGEGASSLWTLVTVADGEVSLMIAGWVPMRGSLSAKQRDAIVSGTMDLPATPTDSAARCEGKGQLRPTGRGLRVTIHERLIYEIPKNETCNSVLEVELVF